MISIRTQLTLFYSIAAFVLMTTIAVFIYLETVNILYKADYQFLLDEVDTIQYILHNANDSTDLKREIIDIPAESTNTIYSYFVRIIDENHNIYIQTPGIDKILPMSKNVSQSVQSLAKKDYLWYEYDDKNYLLIQSAIKFKHGQKGVIQIALDISSQHSFIKDRINLIFALSIGCLLSFFLGFFITKRGMSSLTVLTQTAKTITATSLHQRLDPKSWPKELRDLGVAFNAMLNRIELSFLKLKQFSADLAHELRSPIQNMIGQTEISLSHSCSKEEYQEILFSNLEELNRITHMIENILFLSSTENPQLTVNKQPISVYDEAKIICEYYTALSVDKNISFTLNGKANLLFNPVMFKRLMNNLISNAIKYTPEHGLVSVSISETEQVVHINVFDNGIGIAKEHLPHIFDRFYRVDSSRSQKTGGIGLGLSIVKSIVELHQGSVKIESIVDAGTHVFLTFPK